MSQRTPIRRAWGRRTLAAAMALSLLCPPLGPLLSAARAQDVTPPVAQVAPAPASYNSPLTGVVIPVVPPEAGPIKTILLFPFANAIAAGGTSGGFNPEIVGARVEDAVKLRLNTIRLYKADSFSPTLPQIQRALSESRIEGLTENDITPPYNDAAKGEKITTEVGTDGFLLGAVEALSIDPTSRNVSLTVSATLYSATTGASVKSLAYTGHGISYNAADDPGALLQAAVNDVAGHIVSALNAGAVRPDRRPAPAAYARGKRSNSGLILLGLLIATGIGLAVSSHHHSGGGGSKTGTGTTTVPTTGTPGVPSPPGITVTSSGPPPIPNP